MTTAGNLDWMIVFYIEANGDSPVGEFLGSLDPKTQARFLWSIEQLRARNLQAGEPLVRHIEGKVWELRRESGTNTYRLFYVFLSGRRILFLHGSRRRLRRRRARRLRLPFADCSASSSRKGVTDYDGKEQWSPTGRAGSLPALAG